MSAEEFIRANTAIERTTLVPEISLHLATEVTPLWHATETHLNKMDLNPPFWAFAWVGGQALARYILDRPKVVEGLNVLDIGSGGGIVAIAAVLAGASRVTALDIDPLAAIACRLNADLNGTAQRLRIETGDAIKHRFVRYDLILVGDVCYARGESAELIRCLQQAAAPVLLGDPGRQFLPCDDLRLVSTHAVGTSRELEASAIIETSVWQMNK